MADESDLEKRLGKNAKHVKWTDHLAAGFKPPQERNDYIVNQARARAEEEKRRLEAEAASRAGKPGI